MCKMNIIKGGAMLEVGIILFGILIYFAIGSYYRLSLGYTLAAISFGLYVLSVMAGLSMPGRIIIQSIPFFVMMYRQHGANHIEIAENEKLCPACGLINEPDAVTCAGPRCYTDLRPQEQARGFFYYLPPNVIKGLVLFLVIGFASYEFTVTGKVLITWVYFVWPLLLIISGALYFIITRR